MTMKKPTKKVTESLELVDNVATESIELDTSYEVMTPDPVPATDHVLFQQTEMMEFPRPTFERLLPIVSTVLASIAVGATILGVGVMIGTGL